MIKLIDLLKVIPALYDTDLIFFKDGPVYVLDSETGARYYKGDNGEILLSHENTYLGYMDFFNKEVIAVRALSYEIIGIYVRA